GIFHGLTATIGFWHNQNGQALLKSFGNTSNGLSLANWLATTMPNLFGKNAPAFNVASTTGTNLTNRSNTDVAAYFLSLFGVSGQKSYAQVLSTAFAVFTTTNSLDAGSASRALALKYGFILSNSGGGAATFAVPQADWAAFGITSSTSATKTIIQLLLAANNNAVAGKLNGGNTTLINETNDVFNTVNNRGDIGTGMALVTSESGAYTLMTDSLGHVFAGTYLVQIDPSFSADQVARIEDAINNLDLSLSKYGVVLAEMPQGISASPDIDIHYSTTSSIGGMADGVLGVTELGGHITIINGWNYYLSGDPSGIVGSGQYDFQTVVTHELGHSLGLGHSTDTNSVMYPALSTGEARRSLTSYDLSMLDNDVEPAAALHAVVPRSVKLANDRTKLTDARQHLLKDKAQLKATKHADERAYHAALHQYHLALRTAAHKHSAPSASIADLTAEVRRLRDAVLNDRSAIVTTTRADLAAIRNARQALAAGQAAK
ncbi:MAG: Cadherin proteinputative collagen-binding protein, partial [Phycisphaerales bacterium]|nr:Cadherin proteinputative collagen-binding protein [Phycisphaerales bacterium]